MAGLFGEYMFMSSLIGLASTGIFTAIPVGAGGALVDYLGGPSATMAGLQDLLRRHDYNLGSAAREVRGAIRRIGQ